MGFRFLTDKLLKEDCDCCSEDKRQHNERYTEAQFLLRIPGATCVSKIIDKTASF